MKKLRLTIISLGIIILCFILCIGNKSDAKQLESLDSDIEFVVTKDIFVSENKSNSTSDIEATGVYYLTAFLKNENKIVNNMEVKWNVVAKYDLKSSTGLMNMIQRGQGTTNLKNNGVTQETATAYLAGNPENMAAECGHSDGSNHIEYEADDVLNNKVDITFNLVQQHVGSITLKTLRDCVFEKGNHVLFKIRVELSNNINSNFSMFKGVSDLTVNMESLDITEDEVRCTDYTDPRNLPDSYNLTSLLDGSSITTTSSTISLPTSTSTSISTSLPTSTTTTTSSTTNTTTLIPASTSTSTTTSSQAPSTTTSTLTSTSTTTSRPTTTSSVISTTTTTSSTTTTTSTTSSTITTTTVAPTSTLTSTSTTTSKPTSTSTSTPVQTKPQKEDNWFKNIWLTLFEKPIYILYFVLIIVLVFVNILLLVLIIRAKHNLHKEEDEYQKDLEDYENKKLYNHYYGVNNQDDDDDDRY